MRVAILTFGASAALALAAGSATAGPTVVTSASAASPAPLEARCVVGPERPGGSDVECLVQQKGNSAAAATPMRIVIQTQASAPCPARAVQEVAIPAAAAPARKAALPQVVQAEPAGACAF